MKTLKVPLLEVEGEEVLIGLEGVHQLDALSLRSALQKNGAREIEEGFHSIFGMEVIRCKITDNGIKFDEQKVGYP